MPSISPPALAAALAASLAAALALEGCSLPIGGRRSAGPAGDPGLQRQDPALSGDGRVLASLVERGNGATVVLQEQPSGRWLPLRHLRGHQPHSSPSLSWNGRYLAVLVRQGSGRLAVIEDRASGRLHRLQLPGIREPERLSLAPDGRRLAVEQLDGGRPQLRLFDLSGLLEPDLPAGLGVQGGGLPAQEPPR